MPNPISKLRFCFSRRRSSPSSPSNTPPHSTHSHQVPLLSSPSPSSSSSPLKPLTPSISSSTSAASDLSSAIATRRLLPASPGNSNSIVDSHAIPLGIGLAVPTYSPDPRAEFRRSMEEMAAVMGLVDPVAHGDRLYELLLCYLALNRKPAHEYIVAAFADLLAALAEARAGL